MGSIQCITLPKDQNQNYIAVIYRSNEQAMEKILLVSSSAPQPHSWQNASNQLPKTRQKYIGSSLGENDAGAKFLASYHVHIAS